MGTVLAVDYGRRRIGLAGSDPLGLLAHPLPPLRVRRPEEALDALAALCRERHCERILVGLPLRPDGSEGPEAAEARAFAERLGRVTGLPVEMVDERLTTAEALERLASGPRRLRRRDRGVVDSVAAVVLLEQWLASRPRGDRGDRPPPQRRPT